eukprot:3268242-Rhodomonas_salina.1
MALCLSLEPVGLESDVALGLSRGTADVALCLSREPVGLLADVALCLSLEPVGPEADVPVAVGLSGGMLGVENQITFQFLLVLLCRNKTSQLKRRHTPTTSTTMCKSQSMRRLAMAAAIKK